MQSRLLIYGVFVCGLLMLQPVLAVNIGDIAHNLTLPILSLRKMIHAVCYLATTIFFLGSIISFKNHWCNPVQVPLLRGVWMLLVAAVMFSLTLLPVNWSSGA